MSDQFLRIVAYIKLKPESIEWAIKNALKEFVEETRKEEGCISYVIHQDLNNINTLIFVEEWKSQAAIDYHGKTEHIKAVFQKLKGHFEIAPDIRIIRPLL